MRLKNIINEIFCPITLIDGEQEYNNLNKSSYIVIDRLEYKIIGIRVKDDNVLISIKPPYRNI